MPAIHSELAALKCELPTPLGRGYASRQEARKAACGGVERQRDFRGTPPCPRQRAAALCTPASFVNIPYPDLPSELAACGGEERQKDFRGTPPCPRQRAAALCTPAF